MLYKGPAWTFKICFIYVKHALTPFPGNQGYRAGWQSQSNIIPLGGGGGIRGWGLATSEQNIFCPSGGIIVVMPVNEQYYISQALNNIIPLEVFSNLRTIFCPSGGIIGVVMTVHKQYYIPQGESGV